MNNVIHLRLPEHERLYQLARLLCASELVYFHGAHLQHVVDYEERLRQERKLAKHRNDVLGGRRAPDRRWGSRARTRG